MAHLPNSTSDANKIVKQLFSVDSPDLEAVDYYSNYHYPYRWTPLDEHIALQIAHRARSFMPTYRTNFSPFQAGRRREGRVSTNPSMTGQSSTGSTASANSTSSSSSSSESSDAEENDIDSRHDEGGLMMGAGTTAMAQGVAAEEHRNQYVSFADRLPSMREVYGCEVHEPNAGDLAVYKRYVQMGKAQRSRRRTAKAGGREVEEADLRPTVDYGTDCYRHVREPTVDACSMDVYEAYVGWPEAVGAQTVYSLVSASDAKLLRDYVAMGEEY